MGCPVGWQVNRWRAARTCAYYRRAFPEAPLEEVQLPGNDCYFNYLKISDNPVKVPSYVNYFH